MRRYTLYNQLMAVAAGLCLCWLCVACGEDRGGDLPNDDPNSCVVTITLWTSRSARPPQTKAGETITWEDDDEYERDITDWLVVAYDDEITPRQILFLCVRQFAVAGRWYIVVSKNYWGTFLGGTVGGEDIGLGNEYRYKE